MRWGTENTGSWWGGHFEYGYWLGESPRILIVDPRYRDPQCLNNWNYTKVYTTIEERMEAGIADTYMGTEGQLQAYWTTHFKIFCNKNIFQTFKQIRKLHKYILGKVYIDSFIWTKDLFCTLVANFKNSGSIWFLLKIVLCCCFKKLLLLGSNGHKWNSYYL